MSSSPDRRACNAVASRFWYNAVSSSPYACQRDNWSTISQCLGPNVVTQLSHASAIPFCTWSQHHVTLCTTLSLVVTIHYRLTKMSMEDKASDIMITRFDPYCLI